MRPGEFAPGTGGKLPQPGTRFQVLKWSCIRSHFSWYKISARSGVPRARVGNFQRIRENWSRSKPSDSMDDSDRRGVELSRCSSLLGSASHPESDILGPRERRVAHI